MASRRGTVVRLTLIVFLVVTGARSFAQDKSECRDGLVPDTYTFRSDSYSDVLLLELISKTRRKHFSGDAAVQSLTNAGYITGDGSLKYGSLNHLYSHKELQVTQSDKIDFVISRVDETVRLKYFECVMKSSDVSDFSSHQQRSLRLQQQGNSVGVPLLFSVHNLSPGGAVVAPGGVLRWTVSFGRHDGEPGMQLRRQALQQLLATSAPSVGDSGSNTAIRSIVYPAYDSKKDLVITVQKQNQSPQGVLVIPADPGPIAPPPQPWWQQAHSLPIAVTMHIAQHADQCRTINVVGQPRADVPASARTECNLGAQGWAVIPQAQVQEFRLTFDSKAWHTYLPSGAVLAPEELSFRYRCTYSSGNNAFARGRLVDYPRNGAWHGPGESCGNQRQPVHGGEPRLVSFVMELTGTMKDRFRLTYRCQTETGAVIGWLREGSRCGDGRQFLSRLSIALDTLAVADPAK